MRDSENSSPQPEPLQQSSQQINADDNAVKLARMRSDLSSEGGSGSPPSSPHFYSSSVRRSDPSLDSYSSSERKRGAFEAEDEDFPSADSASERQFEEQAVKLDLLRRAHSQRAKETLEQLQIGRSASGASSQANEAPNRQSQDSNISSDAVRQQSQQLRLASEELKRLAVEQRTSAEDAVANFLFQVSCC